MIKPVEKGCFYCVTAKGACTIKTVGYEDAEYLITELDDAGQVMFCAPTWKVEISDDTAILTETFKRAGSGNGAGASLGGGSGKLKIKLVTSYEEIEANPKKGVLYLVPAEDGNFDEYIYVIKEDGTRSIERIGSYSLEKSIKADIEELKKHFKLNSDGTTTVIADSVMTTGNNGVVYVSSLLS